MARRVMDISVGEAPTDVGAGKPHRKATGEEALVVNVM
jgi:hypothetical protein